MIGQGKVKMEALKKLDSRCSLAFEILFQNIQENYCSTKKIKENLKLVNLSLRKSESQMIISSIEEPTPRFI
jgi:hypothetical protein